MKRLNSFVTLKTYFFSMTNPESEVARARERLQARY